jgi:MraZ protein
MDMVERCLLLYPSHVWERVEESINNLPSTHPSVAEFKRHFLGSALESDLDKQGRILIPAEYRDYGSLNGSALFLGLGDKMEIWNRESRDAKMQEVDPRKVMEDIFELGGRI